jgi:DeoR family fructose operon transcriptional repressor
MARQLLGRSLHMMTNSLPIAETFKAARQIELTLTGGYLCPQLGVMLGPFCEQMLSRVAADVLIMGLAGMTRRFSATTTPSSWDPS